VFSDNYIRLCKEKGVGVTVASQEIGYSANSGKKWSEGSVPRKTTLLKIAEYFGVTVDELMEGQPTMSYGGAPLLDTKKAATSDGDGLSDKELLLLSIFNSLPEDRQWAILRQAQAEAQNQPNPVGHPKAE
jgi:transcriptional regulator with XRE-family HTH domain